MFISSLKKKIAASPELLHSLAGGSFLKATSKHWAGKFSHPDGKGCNMQKKAKQTKNKHNPKKKIKTRYQTVYLSIFFVMKLLLLC